MTSSKNIHYILKLAIFLLIYNLPVVNFTNSSRTNRLCFLRCGPLMVQCPKKVSPPFSFPSHRHQSLSGVSKLYTQSQSHILAGYCWIKDPSLQSKYYSLSLYYSVLLRLYYSLSLILL